MNEQDIIIFLEKVGAIITASHIVYRSGKHGSVYVNKDAIYPHAVETSHLCRMIAERFVDEFVKNRIQVVIAPAIGGVILSYETARQLSEMTGCKVLSVYAEKSKNNGSFVIKRGYDKLIFGKNVLVVEDVVTTGGSVRKVIETTRAAGGKVIGLGVICNRGSVTPQDVADIPKFIALVHLNLDMWDETTCPLCKHNVPINMDVGKGREFVARKRE